MHHSNLKGGNSQGGFIIFLLGSNGDALLITWQSKKTKANGKEHSSYENIGT